MSALLVATLPGLLASCAWADDFTWSRTGDNGNWSGTTNWTGPTGRYPDDPNERAIFNNPSGMGMPIQNASMSDGLGQLTFNYTGWTVYVDDAPLRFNSISNYSYNAINCYATGGAGEITLYPQIEFLSGSQNIHTASGATLVIASPSSGFIGSYAPTISSFNPTSADTGAVRIEAPSTVTAPFFIRQGTVLVRHSSGLGASTGTINIGGDNYTVDSAYARLLTDASGITISKPLRIRSLSGHNVQATLGANHATGASTFSGAVTLDLTTRLTAAGSSTATFSGAIGGAGGIIKEGTGTVVLSATNTYQGNTTINAGVLRIAGSAALPATTDVTLANVSGAALNLAAASSINSLSGGGSVGGNVVIAGGTLTVNSGSFAGAIQGSGTLRKTGSGTLALYGTSTFSGITDIQGGTLMVNGSLAAGGATVSIGSSGVLAGTGTIYRPVSVLSGGVISPGNSIAALTTGNLTWAGGGSYLWEIQEATGQGMMQGWDLLNLTANSTLTITATAQNQFIIDITADVVSNWDPYGQFDWVIATAPAGIVGFDPDRFVLQTDHFQPYHPGQFSLSTVGNSLVLSYAIPEPGTYSLLLAIGAMATFRRMRRTWK